MAFSLDTRDFPQIANFDQAAALWARRKPWRDQPNSVRPLEKRSKKHCQIIRFGTDDIRCRLHGTDVVRYSPQGVTIDLSYGSISTDNFIAALLRHSPIRAVTNKYPATAWRTGDDGAWWGRGWAVEGKLAIFDKDYNLTNPRPLQRPAIDRTHAKVVRVESGYEDFVVWRAVYRSMGGDLNADQTSWRATREPDWRSDRLTPDEVVDLLKERGDAWRDLASQCSNTHILNSVYRKHPSVVTMTTVEMFDSFNDFENWRKLDARYSWAYK